MAPEMIYKYIYGNEQYKPNNFVSDVYSMGLISTEIGHPLMEFPCTKAPTIHTISKNDDPLNFPCYTDKDMLGPVHLV